MPKHSDKLTEKKEQKPAPTPGADKFEKKQLRPNSITKGVKQETKTIRVLLGDISKRRADAVVCPAMPTLQYSHSGGVQEALGEGYGYAFFNKEGEEKEVPLTSAHIRPLKIARGKPKYVILTVNVDYELEKVYDFNKGDYITIRGKPFCREATLRASIQNVLKAVEEHNEKAGKTDKIHSVAFPLLGTGNLGGMMRLNVPVFIIEEFQKYFKQDKTSIKELTIVMTPHLDADLLDVFEHLSKTGQLSRGRKLEGEIISVELSKTKTGYVDEVVIGM